MADAETLPTGEPSRPLLPAGRPLRVVSMMTGLHRAEVVSTEMFANVAGLRTDRRWGTLSGLLSSSCQSQSRARRCWRDRRDWQLVIVDAAGGDSFCFFFLLLLVVDDNDSFRIAVHITLMGRWGRGQARGSSYSYSSACVGCVPFGCWRARIRVAEWEGGVEVSAERGEPRRSGLITLRSKRSSWAGAIAVLRVGRGHRGE